MPYREETWNPVFEPPQFPAPDRDGTADIAVVGLGEERPIGWLVRQDDALEWYTSEDLANGHRGGVRALVEEILRDALLARETALDAWLRVIDRCPIAEIEIETPLGEFYERLRVLWSTEPAE